MCDAMMLSLPHDIQQKIMSYIIPQQDPALCADIRHYTKTLLLVTDIYTDMWGWTDYECRHDWLINDILMFLNEYLPTRTCGYSQKIYDVINRHAHSQSKMRQFAYNEQLHAHDLRIVAFFDILKKKSPIYQVRFMWGLMNVRERNLFRFSLINV